MKTIIRRHHSLVLCVVTFAALLVAEKLTAQLPGVPVLQNAFANPGFTIAVNYGRSDSVQAYAGAVSWAPASARFQLTAGFGSIDPKGADRSQGWGARASVPITQTMMGGKLGIGAFAGVGGASDSSNSSAGTPWLCAK